MRPPPRWHWLLLLLCAVGADGSLTLQEAFECQLHPGILAFETHGGVLLELMAMAYILVVLYVLIEEHYVPTLELISTKEVLNIPAPLVGCTIMAAGNCIGDLSISLVAMIVSGAEVGTGEVLGACVFDLLGVLGIVCLLLPAGGLRLPRPLMVYFLVWIGVTTTLDAMLFYTSVELTWYMANVMVLAYLLFVTGLFFFDSLARSIYPATTTAISDATPASGAGGAITSSDAAPLQKGKKAAPKESSPLLEQPRPEGGADADVDAGPPPGSCLARCGRIIDVLSVPPRWLFEHTIVDPHKKREWCGGARLWPLTVASCVSYSLGLSYCMVSLASRAICLLSIHKNSLGAILCLLSGFPDLITVSLLCRRPGMHLMAATNAFGAFAFNSCFSLGFPWMVIGLYSDVLPPSETSWAAGVIGFGAIAIAVLLIAVNRLHFTRLLGAGLLLTYLAYLVLIISGFAVDIMDNLEGSYSLRFMFGK